MSESKKRGTSKTKDFDEKITFLVVDDDPQVLQTVTESLESFGASKVMTASNGKEAIQILESNPIGFVISDWEMPDMSGLELKRALSDDKRWKHIPFIIITSPTSYENLKVEEAALSAVDAYLIKPFRSNLLKQKIEDVMWKQALERRKAVLVVDDDENVRATVKAILESMKFNPIYEASDGKKAFQIFQEKHLEIAIVISDWEMPHASGIELLRKIRIDQALSKPPFIMVTSQESNERTKLKKAIEAHVDQYLMKPFKANDLRAKVNSAWKNWILITEIQRNLDRANGHLEANSYVEAELHYKKVLAMNPKCIDAYLGLAECYNLSQPLQKSYEEVTDLIRKAIQCDPKADRAYLAMAELLESRSALGETVVWLQNATLQCPQSDMLHYQLGRVLMRLGRFADGHRALSRALEINPNLEEALVLQLLNS